MINTMPAISKMTQDRPPCGGTLLLLFALTGLNLAINAMVSPRSGGHARIETDAQ